MGQMKRLLAEMEEEENEYTFTNPYVGFHQWPDMPGSSGYWHFEVYKDNADCWWWSEVDLGSQHTGSGRGPYASAEDAYHGAIEREDP